MLYAYTLIVCPAVSVGAPEVNAAARTVVAVADVLGLLPSTVYLTPVALVQAKEIAFDVLVSVGAASAPVCE